MRRSDREIFLGPAPERRLFLGIESPHHLRRCAHHHRARWNHRPRCHHRTGGDEAAFPHPGAVENGGAHPDQTLIADRAGMHNCSVTDRAPVAHDRIKIVGQMHNGIVLNIRAFSDLNTGNVTAKHRPIEHAAARFEGHVTHHGGVRGDKQGPRNVGPFLQVPGQAVMYVHGLDA